MIAELAVILIMLSVVIFVYLKSTLIGSFNLMISAIVGTVAAFGFYEFVARIVIGYGFGGEWTQAAIFLLIFVVVSLMVQAVIEQIMIHEFYFGEFPDKIGRSIIGAFTGFLFAGVVLIAVAMAPVGTKWPYQRFAGEVMSNRINPDKSLVLGADAFAVRIGSMLSKGSMSGKQSLAVFHPDMVNEIHLNRIGEDENNLSLAGKDAIKVKSAWFAPQELVIDGKGAADFGSQTKALIVKAALSAKIVKEGGAVTENGKVAFTMSQVRLICKQKDLATDLTGSGEVVFPIGYIKESNTITAKGLTEEIQVSRSEFTGGKKWYDFVFYIPKDSSPVMLQFKENAVDSVGKLLAGENIPQ